MPSRRMTRSLSADGPLPYISSGLVPSVLFVACPQTPPPQLPPETQDRFSSGPANSIMNSSLLGLSLLARSAPPGRIPTERPGDPNDGAPLDRSPQPRNNNCTADEASPNRTRASTTSADGSGPAAVRGSSGAQMESDEHRQLREVGRPTEDRGSEPDTSLYDYAGARDVESPTRTQDDDIGDFDSTLSPTDDDDQDETDDDRSRAQHQTPKHQKIDSSTSPDMVRRPIDSGLDVEETAIKTVQSPGVQFGSPVLQSTPENVYSSPRVSSLHEEPPSSTTAEIHKPSPRNAAELRQECKTLKETAHRLNVELSKYQAKYRAPSADDTQELGLPTRGPPPSWLINTKYLAPLFLAYDDRIREKDGVIRQYEEDLARFQNQVEAVMRENRSLNTRPSRDDADGSRRRKRAEGAAAIGVAEWQPLQRQALLVLEENEVLLEQLRVQDEKLREACRAHGAEVATLTKKLVAAEAGRTAAEAELGQLRVQAHALRAQNETLAAQAKTKVDGILHQTLVADYNQKIEALKESKNSEVDGLAAAFREKSEECSQLSLQLADLQAINKRLSSELSLSDKANRKLQETSAKLQQALESVDDKRRSTKAMLSDVVRAADQAAAERDALVKIALKQEKGKVKILHKMAAHELSKEKLAEKLKMSRQEVEDELLAERQKIKELVEEYAARQREHEREIKHLRLQLREKDLALGDAAHEKRQLENEIELVWQATKNEKRRNDKILQSANCSPCRYHSLAPDRLEADDDCCRLTPDFSHG